MCNRIVLKKETIKKKHNQTSEISVSRPTIMVNGYSKKRLRWSVFVALHVISVSITVFLILILNKNPSMGSLNGFVRYFRNTPSLNSLTPNSNKAIGLESFRAKSPNLGGKRFYISGMFFTDNKSSSFSTFTNSDTIIFPKQQQNALVRPWDRLTVGQPFWQSVDDKMDVLMYSAHYDDVEKLPVIPVVGIARVPLPYSKVTCRYHGCLRCSTMLAVSGSVDHVRGEISIRYLLAYVVCPLPTTLSPDTFLLPFALTLHKESQTSSLILPIPIHYSNTTQATQSAYVQNLIQQRSIILKEGDVEVFASLWKYAKENFRFPNHNPEMKTNIIDMEKKEATKRSSKQAIPSQRENKEVNDKENMNDSNYATHAQESINKVYDEENINHHKNSSKNNATYSQENTLALDNKDNGDKSQKVSNLKKGPTNMDGSRWKVTRCFPALQKNFDQHVLLAEMVAASRALGVDNFVFYVESVGPKVNATLQILQTRGVAQVLPWNMHMANKDVFYRGQFSAIQDCLYRNLRSSHYVLTGDVDELFVPLTPPQSLGTLLDAWFDKKPQCGAFLFQHACFNPNLPPSLPEPLPSSDGLYHPHPHHNTTTTATINNHALYALAKQYNLTMYLHTRRHTEIQKLRERSKVAQDPRRILVGSVHVVEKLRKGFRSCDMSVQEGMLYHYRALTLGSAGERARPVRRLGAKYVPGLIELLHEVDERLKEK